MGAQLLGLDADQSATFNQVDVLPAAKLPCLTIEAV